MRLSKDDTICGIPAPAARTLLRRIGRQEWYREGVLDALAKQGVGETEMAIDHLIQGGILEVVDVEADSDILGATTAGAALAMASFGKPITRATADRLIAGLLERAQAYNNDSAKPMFIRRLRVFGSYLSPDTERLGDVDVEVMLEPRAGISPAAVASYGKQSGKSFPTYFDSLIWPQIEAMQILRNRSTALSLTPQNIDELTDRSRVVFTAEQ